MLINTQKRYKMSGFDIESAQQQCSEPQTSFSIPQIITGNLGIIAVTIIILGAASFLVQRINSTGKKTIKAQKNPTALPLKPLPPITTKAPTKTTVNFGALFPKK